MSKLPGGGSIVTLVATMLIVAAIGAVVALPALRLSGIYLALATGAFAVLMTNLVFNQGEWFPQANVDVPPLSLGFVEVDSPRGQFIMLAAAFCVLGLAVVALRKSTLGRRLVAMKDSEVAIGTLGQNTRALKLVAFSISAAIGAAAGALVGTRVVITDDYSFVLGLSVVLLAVVGGVSAVSGALLGGVFLGGNFILAEMVPSLSNVTKVLPGTLGITMGRSPDGVSGELRANYGESGTLRWPLAVGTAGGVLLWALAQTDVISKWTFTVTLVVLVVAVMPMLPALFVTAITPARRVAMATLMVAALATAVGIDWGDGVGRQRAARAGDHRALRRSAGDRRAQPARANRRRSDVARPDRTHRALHPASDHRGRERPRECACERTPLDPRRSRPLRRSESRHRSVDGVQRGSRHVADRAQRCRQDDVVQRRHRRPAASVRVGVSSTATTSPASLRTAGRGGVWRGRSSGSRCSRHCRCSDNVLVAAEVAGRSQARVVAAS